MRILYILVACAGLFLFEGCGLISSLYDLDRNSDEVLVRDYQNNVFIYYPDGRVRTVGRDIFYRTDPNIYGIYRNPRTGRYSCPSNRNRYPRTRPPVNQRDQQAGNRRYPNNRPTSSPDGGRKTRPVTQPNNRPVTSPGGDAPRSRRAPRPVSNEKAIRMNRPTNNNRTISRTPSRSRTPSSTPASRPQMRTPRTAPSGNDSIRPR